MKGIEPSYEAWEAAVLPLNYTRKRANSSVVAVIAIRVQAPLGAILASSAGTLTRLTVTGFLGRAVALGAEGKI